MKSWLEKIQYKCIQYITKENLLLLKDWSNVDVKPSTYIDFDKENTKKDPKFKVSDHVRISKYKKKIVKGFIQNWSEEVFVIKKVKSTVSWTYVISNLKGEEVVWTFYGKELQKTYQKEFSVEKVIKRSNKLRVNGNTTIMLLTVELIRQS